MGSVLQQWSYMWNFYQTYNILGEDLSGQKFVAYSPALQAKVAIKKIDLLNQSWVRVLQFEF